MELLNLEYSRKLLAALKSGEYKPTTGQLKDGSCMCAEGVLLDILCKEGAIEGIWSDDGISFLMKEGDISGYLDGSNNAEEKVYSIVGGSCVYFQNEKQKLMDINDGANHNAAKDLKWDKVIEALESYIVHLENQGP